MTKIFGSLTALGLFGGSSALGSYFSRFPAIELPAVRKAKAAFTAPKTIAPWQSGSGPDSAAAKGAAVGRTLAMKTIIDSKSDPAAGGNRDVQNSFTVYKALDRLQIIAEAAVKANSTTARAALQKSFDRGLADLQGFMQSAEGDKLRLSFDSIGRTVKSSVISAAATRKVAARPITNGSAGSIPGLAGTERIAIHLAKNGHSEDLVVDLSTLAQPPTLAAVVTALNDAVGATVIKDDKGVPIKDKDGKTISRWQTRFKAVRIDGDNWGMAYELPESERVTVRQAGAPDALMIVNGQATGSNGATTPDGATVALRRQNDPAGATSPIGRLATLSATDRLATERATLLQKAAKPMKLPKGVALPTIDPTVHADLDVRAAAGDGSGNSYLVGTTKGDFGGVVSEGGRDLYLTKVDSRGAIIWQRTLGVTGDADGAAVAVDAAGAVTIAGHAKARIPIRNPTTGEIRYADSTDQDIVVARFSARGDTMMQNVVRAIGNDTCTALTVGANGAVFVGGRGAQASSAYLLQIDDAGRMVQRRDLSGVDNVSALAVGKDGNVVALTRAGGTTSMSLLSASAIGNDLATLSLGTADGRALAVAADGTIAVAGTTDARISGAQANAPSGARDGFVARVDAALAGASTTYIGAGGDDQIDSIAFLGSNIHVGGRTDSALKNAPRGPVDGFVAHVDAATGAVGGISQFGQGQVTTGPVRIVTLAGGGGSLQALGLPNGELAPVGSQNLTATTSLNAGDTFAVSVDGGRPITFTIAADDTLETLTRRMSLKIRRAATVSTAVATNGRQLSLGALPGHSVTLVAGKKGSDALAKLGLSPRTLKASVGGGGPASLVKPGGDYALDLSRALTVDTKASAQLTLGKLKSAISIAQSGYRSLYWDQTKAALLSGNSRGDRYTESRTAAYRAALARLSS